MGAEVGAKNKALKWAEKYGKLRAQKGMTKIAKARDVCTRY